MVRGLHVCLRQIERERRLLHGIVEGVAQEQDRALLSVDLSSPSAPTARFVGSQPNVVGPDPSADVETASKGRDREDDQGRSDGERDKADGDKKSSTSP